MYYVELVVGVFPLAVGYGAGHMFHHRGRKGIQRVGGEGGDVVSPRIPFRGIAVVCWKQPEGRSCAYTAHQADACVGIGQSAVGQVGAHGILKQIVAAMVKIFEGGVRPACSERAGRGSLCLYHGLVLPVVVVEQPSGEHLFGSQSLVAFLAVYFYAEVAGHGLERHHSVAVEDQELAEIAGEIRRYGRGNTGGIGCGRGGIYGR